MTPRRAGAARPARDRPTRRSRKTSRELVAAARDVLSDEGLAGLTVKAVTTRADVGHGTFYHHFESAEHVLGVAIEGAMQELAEQLAEQHSAANDKAWVVVDSTASLFGMLGRHPALEWMLARPSTMAEALRRALGPHVRRDVEALAAEGAVDRSVIDRLAPFWTWLMIGGLAAVHDRPATGRTVERDLIEALLRMSGLELARVRLLLRRLDARPAPTTRSRRR